MSETERRNDITVTVGFPAATVYDVRGGLSIAKGGIFTLKLENFNRPLEWFADNDSVLDIKVSEDTLTANVTALEVGDSEIEVQFRKNTVKLIKVIVIDSVSENATEFKVTVDKPEPK